jgi:2OG-Fe(II) oxygenase superfamily
MIEFEKWEQQASELAQSFANAKPFELVILDGFCDAAKLNALYDQIPDPIEAGVGKSRDYMFAKNKFEKSSFKEISPLFQELYTDFTSERFANLLKQIVGQNVFVDPAFHGGGIHQGGQGSFLDMHVDFNFHPINRTWFRNLNVLLYLNKDWQPAYKGELKLRHRDKPDEPAIEVAPLFNRCVVMFTRDYTVHGYDPIAFPEGMYRRSLAAYAYSMADAKDVGQDRTTVWYPDQGGATKKAIGKHWPTLVRIKNALFGSATAKNK